MEDQQENPTVPLTIKRYVNKPLCLSLSLSFVIPRIRAPPPPQLFHSSLSVLMEEYDSDVGSS